MDNRRIYITKKMLKDALLNLLSKKNLLDITVKELCDESNINRTTFYRHYDNISDLLDEIIDDISQMIANTNKLANNNPNNSLDYIMDTIKFFYEHHEYDSLIKSGKYTLNRITSNVKDVVSQNFTNKDSQYNHYLMNYIFNGTYGILEEWIRNDRDVDYKTISDIIYTLSKNTVS